MKAVEILGGGMIVVEKGRVLAWLELPQAGFLSNDTLKDVVRKLGELDLAAADLGCVLTSPFSTLSFLALPVVPELKLTDQGLVDVARGELLSL